MVLAGIGIVLFFLAVGASLVATALRHRQPRRRRATRPLSRRSHRISRRSHRISLARQRRRYQAKLRAMERQQLALIYLMWQMQQARTEVAA